MFKFPLSNIKLNNLLLNFNLLNKVKHDKNSNFYIQYKTSKLFKTN